MFVVRNVANLVPPYAPDGRAHGVSAALEFGVVALKVKHIVVLGHAQCGGVRAVAEDGDISLHGAYFGVASGRLSVRDPATGEFMPIAAEDYARIFAQPRF